MNGDKTDKRGRIDCEKSDRQEELAALWMKVKSEHTMAELSVLFEVFSLRVKTDLKVNVHYF